MTITRTCDRFSHVLVLTFVLVLVLVPLRATAQTTAAAWPGLDPNGLETVFVRDSAGVETTGKLLAWTPDALLIWSNGAERRLDRADVTRVQKRDSLKNGVVAGAVVGSVMGLMTAAISDCSSSRASGCPGSRAALAVFSTVTYTGLGVGIDALIRGRTTIYDAEAGRRRTALRGAVSRTGASVGVGVRW